MPVELPAPDRTILNNAPLQLVVCQVRFDEAELVNDRATARRFFDKLGGASGPFPKLAQIVTQQVTLNIQPSLDEAPTTKQQRGWRFSNPAGDLTISLLPNSLAVETTAYRSWEEFAPHVERALDVLADDVGPAIEQRLGLRFVNLIIVDEVPDGADWEGFIAPELLAPARHPVLGPGLTAAQHRVILDLGDDLRCILNYGHASGADGSGREGYLLDLDIFREQSVPFSATDVFKASEVMNTRAVSVFQQLVTSRLLGILRSGKGIDATQEQS